MSWEGVGGVKLARAWLEHAERAAGLGFWSWTCNTQEVVWSREVYRILGIEPRPSHESVELALRHVWPDDVELARTFVEELMRGGQRSAIELRAVHADGAPRLLSVSAEVERAADGAAVSVYGTVLDVTRRKHADEALIESEQRLRFLNVLNEAISAAAPEEIGTAALRVLGEHLQVTRCTFGVVQADGDTIIMAPDYAVNCVSIVGPLQISLFGEDLVRAFSAGRPLVVHDTRELTAADIARLDAIQVRAFIGHSLIRQGKMRAIMAVHMSTPRRWTDAEISLVKEVVERCWSMIEQRAAEGRLRESEALFRIAGQAARIGGFYIDIGQEERIVLSDEACAIIEVAHGELLTREDWLALISDDKRDEVRSLLERGEPFDVELSIESGKGRKRWVRWIAQVERDAAGVLRRVHGAVQDIDERHKLEQQLRQSQKLEAIGLLAGGIAHDFNNMLSVILSYVSLISSDLDPNSGLASDIEQIERAATRAGELTQQLLAFSRQQVRQPRMIDLNKTVREIEKLLKRTVNDDISVALHTAEGPIIVLADPGQLEQILINLVINARDAMPSGGSVTIEIASVNVDDGASDMDEQVPKGEYAVMRVSDTGIGMSVETRARIFEPFFTTKDKRKGTGLGLSTVHGIVAQSGGHVAVQSELGRGSTFSVYLPRAAQPAETWSSVPPPPIPITLRGHETVLVVDDEDQLRTLVCTVLRRNGYHVLDAQNAGEAFMICEHHAAPIELLLTDVIMPRVSGRELAERIQLMRPDMRVLYMSGYAEDAIIHRGLLEPHVAFLEKPLTPSALLHKVREVLDANSTSSFRSMPAARWSS